MKTTVLAAICLLLLTPLVWANSLCEQAQVQSLKLIPLNSDDSEDSCAKSRENLNANEVRILEQLVLIHQGAADLLKVNIKLLFAMPLLVEVKEYRIGFIVSSANFSRIHAGVYPEDNFKMDAGVYIHELGHVLSGTENKNLPPQLVDLDKSSFFAETFSDLLAMTLNKEIITPSVENPTCLDRIRFITDFQTYNYPMEYFQHFSEARILKCCESLTRNSMDPKVLNLCQDAMGWFDTGVVLTKPFDPNAISKVDDHQIGIPILSFLKNFSQTQKLSYQSVFEKMFFAQKIPSQDSYLCQLHKDGQSLWQQQLTRYTVKTLLTDFRKNLSSEEGRVYDRLYTQHAIAKGIIYSEKDVIYNIQRETRQTLIESRKDLFELCNKKIDLVANQNCYLSCKQ